MVLPEIRFLQAAAVLAEELNFSRAAERLHIDQSTLSKQIHELEDQISLRLFVRNHHDVQLTEAGRHFVEEARAAILHAERAVTSATAAERGTDEILNIGRSAYIDPHLIAAILSIHLPLFPRLKMKLWSNYSHELARQVAAGRLDMALVSAVIDTPRLSMMTLAESSMYIALQQENRLANQEELHLEEMRDYIWIVLAPHVKPLLYGAIQTVASEKGVLAADVHQVMTAEEATELIVAYEGVAFLTRHDASRIARDGIIMRPLAEERLKIVTSLAARADNKSRLVSEFVRAVGRKLNRSPVAEQGQLPL
jgi:DNA-binding transcriptional LysR family regulator